MIIVGLGNYGEKYKNTRHNIGFMILDLLAEEMNLVFKKKECKALLSEVFIGGEKQIFAKPQTYMNLSGQSVKELISKNGASVSDVIVLVDDIDLPIGNVRIRKSGSAGTHNGLKSIISEIGTNEFVRIRVGIGEKPHPDMDLADYVLSKFTKKEHDELKIGLENARDAVIDLVNGKNIDIVMGRYNS